MIVARLLGGLGNQMFQYAFGRYLSVLNETELRLDLSHYDRNLNRAYHLEHFWINAKPISKVEIGSLQGGRMVQWIGKLTGFGGLRYLAEKEVFKFHSHYVGKFRQNVYLNGYWQNQNYFLPVRDMLIPEFTPRQPLDPINSELEKTIRGCNSVSLHVRRGDYVSNKVFNSFHGVCSKEYYQAAINFVTARQQEAEFFVFSDDIGWAKENLSFLAPHRFVDVNGPGQGHLDLYLQSICKHQIISNSTFSWWAGWLNNYSGKMVISPAKWLNEGSIDTGDLIPATWIKL